MKKKNNPNKPYLFRNKYNQYLMCDITSRTDERGYCHIEVYDRYYERKKLRVKASNVFVNLVFNKLALSIQL